MRIGLVCPYAWDTPGGVAVHIDDLRRALLRLGHEAIVLAPADDEDALPDYVTSAGKPISVSSNGSVAKITFGPGPAARTRRWLKESDLDILHVHEPMSPSLSILSIWAAEGPIVATWHSSVASSRRDINAAAPIMRSATEKVRARIAVSEAARQSLVEYSGGDAVLIPNGVDCSLYVGDEPLPGRSRGGSTLMFLGRIDEPRKGLPVLLDALPAVAAAVPDVHLLVAGPGEVEPVRAGLPPAIAGCVEFLGLVSQEDKARALHSADLYVAPNTGGESFGIILLEAMAAGAPVVASDLDAFERVLDGGRAGAHFRNEDPADLARVLIALLRDPQRRAELQLAGRARAAQFDWARVARQVVAVYESVTPGDEKVVADLSTQFWGRWPVRRVPSPVRGSGDAG
ncbi:MAG: glycosyltransferase family 4 protein [Candidatus Nanopelagicales bacterium]|jgi:phosphatidylinositol alpha-mannosyltransferase|nr:glycosyltransferase family 4 protein [Candidatus Nanopelagicales bacterium]